MAYQKSKSKEKKSKDRVPAHIYIHVLASVFSAFFRRLQLKETHKAQNTHNALQLQATVADHEYLYMYRLHIEM